MDSLTETFQSLLNQALNFLPRLIIVAIVLIIMLISARQSSNWAERVLKRLRGLPASAVGLVSSTIRFGILLLGVLVILDVLGLGQAVVSAVASLGIVGLVVSFALQDITKQFASGVLLMLSQPFQIGDTIKVGAHEGTVVNLQLRVTVLKTAGGDEILIPNAEVYTSTVINMSRYRERRFAVPFTLPLTNNLTEVRAQLLEAISTTPGIATTPPPSVICTTIADQKVSAEVRYWIARDTPNQDEITTRVIMGIHRVIEQVTGLPADAHAST